MRSVFPKANYFTVIITTAVILSPAITTNGSVSAILVEHEESLQT